MDNPEFLHLASDSTWEALYRLPQFAEACDNIGLTREDFTCYNCPTMLNCEFAWDLYNTNGDCLAEK